MPIILINIIVIDNIDNIDNNDNFNVFVVSLKDQLSLLIRSEIFL